MEVAAKSLWPYSQPPSTMVWMLCEAHDSVFALLGGHTVELNLTLAGAHGAFPTAPWHWVTFWHKGKAGDYIVKSDNPGNSSIKKNSLETWIIGFSHYINQTPPELCPLFWRPETCNLKYYLFPLSLCTTISSILRKIPNFLLFLHYIPSTRLLCHVDSK